MPEDETMPAPRRRAPRADMQRNRARLLAAAAEAFGAADADGSATEVSLDAVARAAGVGIGTLYRHFATRGELLEAVYRDEVERVAGGVEELLADNPADAALRLWLQRFARHVAARRGLAAVMTAALADDAPVFEHCHRMVGGAAARLVGAAEESGAIAGDTDPGDLVRAVVGIGAAGSVDADGAARLAGLLVDGLRYAAGPVP